MADGFATVKMQGNMVKDPQVRYRGDGTPVCSFCVAVNRSNRGFKRVDFIDCVKIGDGAEGVRDTYHKGEAVEVEGSLIQERWKGESGSRSRLVVEAAIVSRWARERVG